MSVINESRASALYGLRAHPHYGRLLEKLNRSEFSTILDFCRDHQDYSSHAFTEKADTMFLDKPKPKNWLIIVEILLLLGAKK